MMEGWEVKELKEVCTFENGDRGKNYPSRSEYVDFGIPFINAGHLEDGSVNLDDVNHITKENFDLLSRGKFQEGDLVFCLRGSLGKFAIINEGVKGAIASSLVIVRPKQETLTKFVGYYFESPLSQQMIRKYAGGTAQPNLGSRDLKKFEIPLPPLDEQKRIVSILDEAFEAIDQAKSNIERNIENAEELFQSKLNNILANPDEAWKEKPLKDITSKIGSGATPRGGKKSYKKSGISLIRSLNVYDNGFKEEDLAFIDDEQASKLDRVKIEKGDVLLNITGASVARCCIVPDKYMPARVNQHVSIIRLNEDTMRPKYLHYCLISKKNKSKLLGISDQGATRQAITKSQIKNFKVRYPKTFEEQDKIIRFLNEFRKFTSEFKSIYKKKLLNLDKLKRSILQQAFSGELTQKELVA